MTADALHALHKIASRVTVRAAHPLDVPALVELGRAFFTVSDMEALASFDAGSFAHSLVGMIDTPEAILLLAEAGGQIVGFAGAMTFPAYWNSAVRIGQETFWWVQPDHRGDAGPVLLAALEDAARDRGARTFLMVSLEALRPGAVGKLYQRRGYLPLEHSYWKAL